MIGSQVEGQPTTGQAGAWLHNMGDSLVDKHPNLDAKVVEEDITALEHVVCWTEWQLLKIPNLGRKSIDELKSYLHSKGLALKEKA